MEKLDIKYLLGDSRARVYLLWAVLTLVGFAATQYYQDKNINFVWFVISVSGLGYMYRVMPLGVQQMKNIFTSWLVPITLGLIVSIIVARGWAWPEFVGYLGVFWLLVMAIGYAWNGLVDRPLRWYLIAAGLNAVAAAACYFVDEFLLSQYMVAAVISCWSMLWLFVFRTE